MAETADTLGARVGASFRRGVASQGKAWAQYGDLLGQFAAKKIEVTDFGRRALDIYIGAVSDVLSAGADAASDTVKTGVDRLSKVRKSAETVVAKAEEAVRKTGTPTLAATVRRRTKTPNRPI